MAIFKKKNLGWFVSSADNIENVSGGNGGSYLGSGAFKKALQVSTISALVFLLAGCPTKQTVTDEGKQPKTVAPPQETPQVENTPISFDLTGSDSGKIEGLETVFFEFDRSSLRSEERKKLDGNVAWLKAHGGVSLQVEGHCDARGSIEYNLALGERRARSVREYMVAAGVDASRLSTISYGKEKPLATGDGESAYARNRRANFVPLTK